MVLCKRCLFPTNKPDLKFTDGICSACLYHETKKNIDWNLRKKELHDLFDNHVGNYWDCVIPISGGKDSHFITYYITQILRKKPLLVSFIPSDQTPLGRKNIENIKHSFDVDCIEF